MTFLYFLFLISALLVLSFTFTFLSLFSLFRINFCEFLIFHFKFFKLKKIILKLRSGKGTIGCLFMIQPASS